MNIDDEFGKTPKGLDIKFLMHNAEHSLLYNYVIRASLVSPTADLNTRPLMKDELLQMG